MNKRTVSSLAGKRVLALFLAGILMTLGALSLNLLVSAQSSSPAPQPAVSIGPISPTLTSTLSLTQPLTSIITLTEVITVATPLVPPVSVDKTASPDTVYPNDTVRYTVLFSNSSGAAVEIERITDTLPSSFLYLSLGVGSDITHNPQGTSGTIVWNQGPYSVPAGGNLRLIYNVRVNALASATPYLNRLQALLATDDVIADSAPVTVVGVNLTGSKSASAGQVAKGNPVIYTVTLENNGTLPAVLSAITDTLPAPFTFRQMISGPLPYPSIQGRKLVWTGPITIPSGGQLRFAYSVTVNGTIGVTYRNSVEGRLSSGYVGPWSASVKVLKPKVYLPLVFRTSPPQKVYRLAYDSKPGDNYEIFVVNADGTNRLNVSNQAGGDADPVWSPDGMRIAWVHYYDGKGDIIVANADGTNKKNLTNHPKDDRAPVWSPDGTRIAFASYRTDRWEVYVMNADGSNVVKLTDQKCQSHDPVWSPDGTKIAFICGLNQYAEVYVMNADGSNETRLTSDPTDLYREDAALDWSPDSTRLAFVKFYNKDHNKGNIYVVNVNTKAITQLTSKETASYSPRWSPDGTKIAFSTYLDGSYEIAVMNPDGSNVVNLTKAAKADFVPRWSPDGSMISFISLRDGNKELYVMNADGTNQFRLTNTAGDELEHDWMP